MSDLKVGDTVTWKSQAGGHVKEKTGTIIHFVEPNTRIPESILASGRVRSDLAGTRPRGSYVVRVDRIGKSGKPAMPMIYWPWPNSLKKVNSEEEQSTAA